MTPASTKPAPCQDEAFHAAVSEELQQRLERNVFQTWFQPFARVSLQADGVRLTVRSPFVAEHLSRRYRRQIELAVASVLGHPTAVEVVASEPTGDRAFRATRAAAATDSETPTSDATCRLQEGTAARPSVFAGTPAGEGESAAKTPGECMAPVGGDGTSAPRPRGAPATFAAIRPTSGTSPTSTSSAGQRTVVPQSFAARRSPLPESSGAAVVIRPVHKTVREPRAAPKRSLPRFDDLIFGSCNQLARVALEAVIREPGGRLNPIYLFGPVGVGKTHLLEALYAELQAASPNVRAVLLTAESFANQYISALQDHAIPAFRKRFRTVDVLIVDDIDFLAGKAKSQQEFLHTCVDLLNRGRQIVVSAACKPQLLADFREELITRFQAGLVCPLEPPDEQTRIRFVRKLRQTMPVPLTDDAVHYVAGRFTRNLRELQGAMNYLQAQAQLHPDHRLGRNAVRSLLARLEAESVRCVQLDDIVKAVCARFAVSPEQLRSQRRFRSLSQPRMLAIYLARRLTPAAYSEIGQYFGGRNHSTIIAAEKKVRRWLQESHQLRVGPHALEVRELLEELELELTTGG
ncbi:MAG: AAA family ATPase [Planctomycetota bacterium]|nr:MAG: AAA family ATPase [Planctomycetota bacterium]